MSKPLRCLIGWRNWRTVEMPDRDKYAEWSSGKRDWWRLIQHVSGEWRGGDPPPGAG
jgi:hypothetical protein